MVLRTKISEWVVYRTTHTALDSWLLSTEITGREPRDPGYCGLRAEDYAYVRWEHKSERPKASLKARFECVRGG